VVIALTWAISQLKTTGSTVLGSKMRGSAILCPNACGQVRFVVQLLFMFPICFHNLNMFAALATNGLIHCQHV
jgi:hypothetical protein